MPVSIGSTRCTGAGPAPFFACVRCALSVLFVIGGSLAPVVGTVSLGRRDSHADPGAVATQFSNSTGTGTSPFQLFPDFADLTSIARDQAGHHHHEGERRSSGSDRDYWS